MGNCFAVTNAGGAHVLFYRKSQRPRRTWEKIWRKLERQIHKSGIHYEAFQTEAPGDARRMAAELTANMQEPATIVAVGGDGTVNEVLNGLAISDLLTVGYIPTGSGNDLARGLHLETDPEKVPETDLKSIGDLPRGLWHPIL